MVRRPRCASGLRGRGWSGPLGASRCSARRRLRSSVSVSVSTARTSSLRACVLRRGPAGPAGSQLPI
eukprot:1908349-Alexandrium_andersonii.AAC.1